MPPRFKDIMEDSLLYPEGWKFREFVGIFRNPSRTTAKKPRMNGNSIVDQVMAEAGQQVDQGGNQLLRSLQQQVNKLAQLQGVAPTSGEVDSGQASTQTQG